MARIAIIVAAVLASGCWGNQTQVGSNELFRVESAQFTRGPLPGKQIEDAGLHPPPLANGFGPPNTSAPTFTQSVFIQGQGGVSFSGSASTNTASIAVRMDGASTGYWVFPVGDLEQTTGRLQWSATADISRYVRSGLRTIRAVAIDRHGNSGKQAASQICIRTAIPDNLHACSPGRDVPQAIITLSWDTDADLDLQVIGPDNRLLEAKQPTTEKVEGGMPIPGPASFDRDSNANCVADGLRVENLVWQDEAPHGRYGLYVNMFDACKQPAARFDLSVYTRQPPPEDGGIGSLKRRFTQAGELLDISANGGTQRGLFVGHFDF